MDKKQQIEFEADLLQLQAQEKAHLTLENLQQFINEGITSEDLLSKIPAECLVIDGEFRGFQDLSWLPDDANKEARELWELFCVMSDYEVRVANGQKEEDAINSLRDEMSQVGLLDRIRLELGLFNAIDPFSG